jgi:hypothetical protein
LMARIARIARKRSAGAAFGAGHLVQNHYPHDDPHCPHRKALLSIPD